jgi:hypothetical protein
LAARLRQRILCELRRAIFRGFAAKNWWTRTQRIRTAGKDYFEVALVDTVHLPVYQEIARNALQLRQLGMSDRAIAARLGVTDKTVAKAVIWLRRMAGTAGP